MPTTNPTAATTTSEPAAAEEQSSTTVETTSTTAEIIPETVPVTRVRATPTTATVLTTSVPRSNASSGEWAIPTYIVMCESGGDWYAHNASGASGPYQIMPMHFGGELAMNQSRAAQHAKAAELWNGGRGRSHWAACL